jgi:hypothetical protein
MAAHFIYKHMAASGLGDRSFRRPYVTGGLGAAVGAAILRMKVASREALNAVSATVEGREVGP